MDRRIAIGCDHGGFALKKELIPFIDSLGYETIDIGCYDENSELIGYYEKHEYRNRETVGLYQPKR